MTIARRLAAIRIAVGVLLVVRTTPLLHLVPGLARNHGGPLFGWPDPTAFRSALVGPPLPIVVVEGLCVVRTAAAILFLVGVRTRAAGVTAAIAGYLVWSQEPFSFIFTVHTLYLATALLALGDAGSARALRPSPARSPRSSLWLIRAFVVAIYAWSAIAKLRGSWLDGSTLEALRAGGTLTGPLADLVFGSPGGARVTAIVVLAGEAALVPLLLARRTRAYGVAIACILHASIEITAHPDVFGFLMVILLASFWTDVDREAIT